MTSSATAQNVHTMIIGRLLAGIGIGISSAIVPLYISEVVIVRFWKSLFFFLCCLLSNSRICNLLIVISTDQISPTEIRGALGSVNQLFICIGILAALIAGLPLAGNPLWYIYIFFLAVTFLVNHWIYLIISYSGTNGNSLSGQNKSRLVCLNLLG